MRSTRQAQLRRRAVALLAELVAQRVEDAEHVLDADRLRPGERPARVVHAERHAVVDVGLRADALAQREERLVDDLATIRPSTRPTQSPMSTTGRPSDAKNWRASSVPRTSSTAPPVGSVV